MDLYGFWAEGLALRDELSTSVTVPGTLWKLAGFMITHIISWHGWWRLSHPRKHPRCLFPNAEIYSSSFEPFLWESFQFCGSHYKTRIFICFRKPPGLRGKWPRLPDPQAKVGSTARGRSSGFWLSQRRNTKSSARFPSEKNERSPVRTQALSKEPGSINSCILPHKECPNISNTRSWAISVIWVEYYKGCASMSWVIWFCHLDQSYPTEDLSLNWIYSGDLTHQNCHISSGQAPPRI